MLCAPVSYSVRGDSLIRANNAIDGMTLKQLRTRILQRCLSGRLTTPYVALIDGTMQHPFRHCLPRRPRAAHNLTALAFRSVHDSTRATAFCSVQERLEAPRERGIFSNVRAPNLRSDEKALARSAASFFLHCWVNRIGHCAEMKSTRRLSLLALRSRSKCWAVT
jgi:hypothetical protein